MKHIKPNMSQIYILNPIILFVGVILIWKVPYLIHTFFYVFWLATAAVFFLLMTPARNLRLGAPSEKTFSFLQWFGRVALIEITLTASLLGASYLTGVTFPINTTLHPTLFITTLHSQLVHLGLFPWATYALVAVGMCKLAYNDQKDAFFSNIYSSITQQSTKGMLSLIINTSARRCNIFATAILFALLTLLILSLFIPPTEHFKNGFQPTTLLTTMTLFIVFYTKKAKSILNKLFSRQIPTQLSLPIFSLTLAAIIGFLSITYHGLYQSQQSPLKIPVIITDIINKPWQINWEILIKIWLVCMTPIISSYFAKISKGFRISTIIMGILALPIILAALILILPTLAHIQWFATPSWSIKAITILSLVTLLPTLINHTTSSTITHSYFPKKGEVKPRDHLPFFMTTAQITAIIFYFFLVIGINGLNIFFFSLNFLIVLCTPFTVIAIVKQVTKPST